MLKFARQIEAKEIKRITSLAWDDPEFEQYRSYARRGIKLTVITYHLINLDGTPYKNKYLKDCNFTDAEQAINTYRFHYAAHNFRGRLIRRTRGDRVTILQSYNLNLNVWNEGNV